MNTLDIAIACNLQPKKAASTHGAEYASACPVCGGNDRFRVWPNKGEFGAWWCRVCGQGGDAIALLRYAKRMSYKEACDYLGKQFVARPRSRTPRLPKAQAPDFIPRDIADPVKLWQAKAAVFAEHCHKALLADVEQLAWLAQRGITAETVKRFKLGWNEKNIWRKRAAWGIEDKLVKNKDGTEKMINLLSLYHGLVIPYFVDGRPHRLRIRRPEGDVRYYVVPGSGMAPMMISPEPPSDKGRAAWVIVESELDAMLIAQDGGDTVGVAALGAVSIRPGSALKKRLDETAYIMVALDADVPAAKAWLWWQEHFTQAERWPVPSGKDPGDYRKAGGDVRAWVLAGLPPGLKPASLMPDNLKEEVIAVQMRVEIGLAALAEEPVTSPAPISQPIEEMEPKPIHTFKQRCTECGVVETVRVYYEPKGYKTRPTCISCFNKKPVTQRDFKRR